jgi:hypothetical protein
VAVADDATTALLEGFDEGGGRPKAEEDDDDDEKNKVDRRRGRRAKRSVWRWAGMRAIDDAVGTEAGDRLLNGRGRFVTLVSISERPLGSAAAVEAKAVNRPRGRGGERARLRGTSGAVAAACDAGSGRSRSACTQEEGRLS